MKKTETYMQNDSCIISKATQSHKPVTYSWFQLVFGLFFRYAVTVCMFLLLLSLVSSSASHNDLKEIVAVVESICLTSSNLLFSGLLWTMNSECNDQLQRASTFHSQACFFSLSLGYTCRCPYVNIRTDTMPGCITDWCFFYLGLRQMTFKSRHL